MKFKCQRYLLLLGGVLITGAADCQTNSSLQWATFTDAGRHFHFEYPSAWKINTEAVPVMHYRDVFVALNSFGAEHFMSREQETSSNQWEYGADVVTNQLASGAVYLEVGWWEYLAPRFGPGIHEMELADLSAVLEAAKETKSPGLVTREIKFDKWGRNWSIMVYLREPVAPDNRQTVERILKSFRFDGVPAGDDIWAIGEARKHLPPEADPDQFTREGGSSIYYDQAKKDGNDQIVTFTKHLEGQPAKSWTFRVTEKGAVVPVASTKEDSTPGQP